MKEKPSRHEVPSPTELAEGLVYTLQQRNQIGKEMHRRLPRQWPKPAKLSQPDFYTLLHKSISDPEAHRQLAEVLEAMPSRSDSWQGTTPLLKRLAAKAAENHSERMLEDIAALPDDDHLDANDDQTPLPAALLQYKRLFTWIHIQQPDNPVSIQDDRPHSGPEFDPSMIPLGQRWDESLSVLKQTVAKLEWQRFDIEAVEQLGQITEQLAELAHEHQQQFGNQLSKLTERLNKVSMQMVGCGDELAQLQGSAREALGEALGRYGSEKVEHLVSAVEQQCQTMLEATQQCERLKQLTKQAVDEDRFDDAGDLNRETKRQDGAIRVASDHLQAALAGLLGSDTGKDAIEPVVPVEIQAGTQQVEPSLPVDSEDDSIRQENPSMPTGDPQPADVSGAELPPVVTQDTGETGLPFVSEGSTDLADSTSENARGDQVGQSSENCRAGSLRQTGLDDAPKRDVAPEEIAASTPTVRVETKIVEPVQASEDTAATTLTVCCSYQEYCEDRWVAPNGKCETAPWLESGFAERLHRSIDESISGSRWAWLLVLSRAQEKLEPPPTLSPQDLLALYQIWATPDSQAAGSTDEDRHQRLLKCMAEEYPRPYLLLLTLLEVMRPSANYNWSSANLESLLDRLALGSADLRTVIDTMLRFQQHGDDGWQRLSIRNPGKADHSPTEILQELSTSRQQFTDRVVELWSAAGGKVQRTHCRTAWATFMTNHVQPIKEQLTPTSNDLDFRDWDLVQLQKKIKKLVVQHRKIADQSEAKFSDRKLMDRRASEIADLALGLVRLMQSYSKAGETHHFHGMALPVEALHSLLDGKELSDPIERICQRTFAAAVNKERIESIDALTGFSEADLWHYPDLLPLLAIPDDQWKSSLPAESVSNPLRAAAVLLHQSENGNEVVPVPSDVPARLRERLIGTRRTELLPYLVASNKLDAQDKTRIHSEAESRIEELYQSLRRLERLRLDVDALSLSEAKRINEVYESARELLEDRRRAIAELPLISGWLEQVSSGIDVRREAALASLRKQIAQEEDPQRRDALRAELDAGRFDKVLHGLQPGSAFDQSDVVQVRETPWRWVAEQRFANPVQPLSEVDSNSEVYSLTSQWLAQRGRNDSAKTRGLRREFYDLVSGEGSLSDSRKKRIMPDGLRKLSNTQIAIDCRVLLDLLRREGLNPTFIPQLLEYSKLVIMSPARAGANNLHQELSRSVSAESGDSLVVFLIPGLPQSSRERILAEFLRRDRNGAVIDDVDICRLVGINEEKRPQGFLALLEIVFEQLDSRNLSPYQSRDGQFVQMEMFVGREREAEKLATSAQYSRVFSGRKLGKSALLKYVAHKYDDTILPSGNRLRVLYIIVAGGDSEHWLADRIIDEIRQAFPNNVPAVSDDDDPGQRLTQFLGDFLRDHTDTSLLIVLDEADAFVEGQLQEYDRVRERCLSFRMMKDVHGGTDRNELPRARFIFSGYRVTNTRAGAWANAGDVLRLAPLNEDEAIKLVEGPLARLGIDASEQAGSIARHCGFQPAIIIRFGTALLKQVQAMHAGVGRQQVQISHEDVVNTFHQAAVQEEIRTINDNNFQGNRVGRIVFWAMLMAFNDLLPGQGLEDAPRRLLERIRQIDNDTGWLRKLDPSETGEILRNLHDFGARELIDELQTASGRSYRMKFPAHLPVLLTEEDPEHQVRQEIQRVREAGRDSHTVTSVLSNNQMDEIRYAMGDDARKVGVRMVVVASHWLGALQNERGGVADRLGKRPGDVVDAKWEKLRQGDLKRDPLLTINAGRKTGGQVLRSRGQDYRIPLLIGGVDLLRWVIAEGENNQQLLLFYTGLARVDETRLAWWYERLRLIRFAPTDAIEQIISLTGSIPALLARWDALLPKGSDIDIDRETFDGYIKKFGNALQEVARKLAGGNAYCRLTQREIELLRMAALVARENGGEPFSLRQEMSDNWPILYAELMPGTKALYSSAEDSVAIEVISQTGLLPVDGQEKVHLSRLDPLHGLLAAMP